MTWQRHRFCLRPRERGVHLVTDEVHAALASLRAVRIGICHLFLRHTSAALTINENADPTVRADLERWLDRTAPDGAAWMRHRDEGDDDMPAHVKCSLLGCALAIPVADGALQLGTWQGIYLVEPRDRGGARSIDATIHGDGG